MLLKLNKTTQKLRQETLAAWALLEAIRLNANVSPGNLEGMQRVFRAFAVEIIKQQAQTTCVTAGGQTLIRFPNETYPTKQAYVEHMSQNRTWLDDAILFPALETLGYQPIMHLDGVRLPPYVPFVQQQTDEPLRIDIINYGAKSGGVHWELKGHSNPGNGNCGAYTVAQKIQKDRPKMLKHIQPNAVQTLQTTLKTIDAKPTQSTIKPPSTLSEPKDNVITREVVKQFKALENTAQERRTLAAKKLETFSTLKLAALYNMALRKDEDYLQGRITEILKETGLDLSDLISKGNLPHESMIDIAREELIHALSVEAWRNPEAFDSLQKIDPPSFKAEMVFDTENNPMKPCAEQELAISNTTVKHTGVPILAPGS